MPWLTKDGTMAHLENAHSAARAGRESRCSPAALVGSLLWTSLVSSAAAQVETFQEQLDVIANYAERICDRIPLEGSGENIELSGEARAELSGVLGRLADLGVSGSGQYQTEEYQGVLQKDLATTLQDARDCRREIHNKLTDRLLFSERSATTQPEPQGPGQPQTSPVRPQQPAGQVFAAYAYCSQTGVTGYATGAASPQQAMALAVDDCIYRGGIPNCCTAGVGLQPGGATVPAVAPAPEGIFQASAYCSMTNVTGWAQGMPSAEMALSYAVDDCIRRGGIPHCCVNGARLGP